MKKINEETKFKPTLDKPMNSQSKGYDKNFKNSMNKYAPDIKLNEVDETLTEAEQSLKKKIFSLAKMEALVFSDPKLSAVYDEMSINGEEKYGYHYNETIMNMIFNDYVLNSPKYLQKYKMSIPKEKKRRDKSGINQLKKAGEERMAQTGLPKQKKTDVGESNKQMAKNETTTASSSGAYVGPAAWKKGGDLMEEPEKVEETTTAGSAGGAAGYVGYSGPSAWSKKGDLLGNKGKPIRKPIWPGGKIIQESNYLTDPSGFEKYVNELNKTLNGDFLQINEQIDIENSDMSQKPNIAPYTNSKINDKIIDKTSAFTSNTVKQWGKEDTNLENRTINTGKMDEPNLKTMKEMKNFEEAYNPDMYSTKEDLKHLIEIVKQRTGKGLTKDHIPMLAGEALYTIAIQLANKMLPVSWNDLPDTNSMWDYIDENGNMSYDRLMTAVKEAVNDRLDEEGMSLEDLMESKITEKAKSKAQQRLFGMARAVQKGTLSPSKVGGAVKKIAKTVSEKDVEDFASTKHKKLPEKVDETDQSIIAKSSTGSMANVATPTSDQGSNVQMGTQQTGGMKESKQFNDMTLLEELNKELEAFSIHQDKLKKMTEDRKPSAIVLKDRVNAENPTNFKKDLQHSGTKEIINMEKELQWKDQQTNVNKDPQKLGMDIEKLEIKSTDATGDEHLKNVGDSTNDKGDEIPKRNLTSKEQEEVNMYRLGQHSLVYDNEPSKRFEDRMKADMGDELYDQRQKQMAFRAKAPMYNKDTQPTDNGIDKVQFNKDESGWNEREGIKESMITGRYINELGKRRLIDFNLNEVELSKSSQNLFELDFTGLGNNYYSKTINNKVIVNESVVKAISENKFYTDGNKVIMVKKSVQKLNENKQRKEKQVINEQFDKMKHLLNYKPEKYTDTKNVKKNRGF